jgi:hypothetical protein
MVCYILKILLVHVRVPRTFGKRLDDSNRLPVSLGHRPNVRLAYFLVLHTNLFGPVWSRTCARSRLDGFKLYV